MKPRIDTIPQMEAAMSALIREFRAPPGTSESVAEAMVTEWAVAQVSERFDIAPEVQRHFALEFIEDDVRREIAADPLATSEQIISRVGDRMHRAAEEDQ